MKKKRRKREQVNTESTARPKPLRKVTETEDGGLILDDRDAEEPFLAPTTPRSTVKKVA